MDVNQARAERSMLATHCAVCRLPLKDPVSIELGMGPTCREKYGFEPNGGKSEVAYLRAKEIVYDLAVDNSIDRIKPHKVLVAQDELMTLGFDKLAQVLVKNNAKIVITNFGDTGDVIVKQPFNFDAGRELFQLGAKSQRDSRNKFVGFVVKPGYHTEVFKVLCKYFPQVLCIGPKGPFLTK